MIILGNNYLHSLANRLKYFLQASIPSSFKILGYMATSSEVHILILSVLKLTFFNIRITSNKFFYVTWNERDELFHIVVDELEC